MKNYYKNSFDKTLELFILFNDITTYEGLKVIFRCLKLPNNELERFKPLLKE